MPMYDYKCPTCTKKRAVFLKLDDLNSTVYCQFGCGSAMNRQISAPFVRGDYQAYDCPITGKRIEGKRAHEENLKQHGCRILEPGETESHKQRRAQEDQRLEMAVEETADRFISSLPTEKRDRLAGEMEGGLTTEVVRSTPKLI